MRKLTILLTLFLGLTTFMASGQTISKEEKMNGTQSSKSCNPTCSAQNKSTELTCKLTSTEIQQRKKTVLKSLRSQVVEKKELANGFAFKFAGSDKVLDELVEFIKTERSCCDFFVFGLCVSGDQGEAWLELTGPKGAKDFIATELEL